jgi:hypothetical protein
MTCNLIYHHKDMTAAGDLPVATLAVPVAVPVIAPIRGIPIAISVDNSRAVRMYSSPIVAKILAKAVSFATKFCESPLAGKGTAPTRFAELRIFAKRDRLANQSKTGSSQLANHQAFPCGVYNLGSHSS